MDLEDELEQMQNEALAELEDNDDTDTNDSEQEESTGSTDNEREDGDDREDIDRNEEENDIEDDEEVEENDVEEDEDDSDNDDDEADDTDTDTEEDSSDFEPIEVNINGQLITLDSLDEVKSYMKNNNSTKPQRQRKSENDRIVEQGALTKEDLALFIDAKNGDPAAIAKIAKQSKIDIYDMDENLADTYQPKFSPHEISEIDEVAEDIMSDEKLYGDFKDVISSAPQDFVATISTDAKALKNFAAHVESGLAQKVIPMAMKAKMLEGGDFLSHYARIGREVAEEGKQKPEDSKTKRKTNPRADKLRKRAQNTKGSNKGTKTKMTGEDIWDMSTEDFNKKYM